MAYPAPTEPASPGRYSVEQYFALVDQGVLSPDDRVELLEGVVVAMSPRDPGHDAAVNRTLYALVRAVGERATVRCQSSLILQPHSVPEPDVVVVPGSISTYDKAHPTAALLAVEVADSSLAQDRITKAALYAAAGVPEYWIINLRDDRVEALRAPTPEAGRYGDMRLAGRGDTIELVSLPGAVVAVNDLLPDR